MRRRVNGNVWADSNCSATAARPRRANYFQSAYFALERLCVASLEFEPLLAVSNHSTRLASYKLVVCGTELGQKCARIVDGGNNVPA